MLRFCADNFLQGQASEFCPLVPSWAIRQAPRPRTHGEVVIFPWSPPTSASLSKTGFCHPWPRSRFHTFVNRGLRICHHKRKLRSAFVLPLAGFTHKNNACLPFILTCVFVLFFFGKAMSYCHRHGRGRLPARFRRWRWRWADKGWGIPS